MFRRYLVACKQQHLIKLIGSIDIHCWLSKRTPPTADSPKRLRYL